MKPKFLEPYQWHEWPKVKPPAVGTFLICGKYQSGEMFLGAAWYDPEKGWKRPGAEFPQHGNITHWMVVVRPTTGAVAETFRDRVSAIAMEAASHIDNMLQTLPTPDLNDKTSCLAFAMECKNKVAETIEDAIWLILSYEGGRD